MKLTIPRKELVKALATVKSAAVNKSSLPILANVEINAFEKSVHFTCTNLDLTLRTKCEAAVQETGATTVRVGLLYELCRSFPGDTVELNALKTKLQIRCGQSYFQLGVLDAGEFPAIPRLKNAVEVKLPQSVLKQALRSTGFCTSDDEKRYVLNGSLLQLNGKLTLVSTDGRRLALLDAELPDKSPQAQAILPAAAVNELLKLLLDDEDSKATIELATNLAQFSCNDTVLYTKIIEGQYPDYRKIIPNIEGKTGVPIGRTDLIQALQRVAMISDTCELEFSRQTLTVRGQGKGDLIGEAQEMLMIPKTEDHTARFNPQYLIEGLNAVDDDQVFFYGSKESNLSLIKVESKPWLCVIAGLVEEKKKTEKAEPKK